MLIKWRVIFHENFGFYAKLGHARMCKSMFDHWKWLNLVIQMCPNFSSSFCRKNNNRKTSCVIVSWAYLLSLKQHHTLLVWELYYPFVIFGRLSLNTNKEHQPIRPYDKVSLLWLKVISVPFSFVFNSGVRSRYNGRSRRILCQNKRNMCVWEDESPWNIWISNLGKMCHSKSYNEFAMEEVKMETDGNTNNKKAVTYLVLGENKKYGSYHPGRRTTSLKH